MPVDRAKTWVAMWIIGGKGGFLAGMVAAFRNGADGAAGLTLGSPLSSELDGDRFLSYVSVFDFLGLLASYASYGSILVLDYRSDDRARSSQAADEASRSLSATGFAGGEGPEKNR